MIVNQQKSKSFIRYLDQQKNKTLDYVDYYSIYHNNMVDYYSNLYHDPAYSGFHPLYTPQTYMRKIDVPSLFLGAKDLSGVDATATVPSPTTETIQIDKVECIADLIELIDKNPYKSGCSYNIDLKSLTAIRGELVSLNNMIGMKTLKTAIVDQLLYFLQKLHLGEGANCDSDFKHTVLFGPPGTGKTEVAKLVGQMYSKMGVLKNNVFKKVVRSDLVAGYLGQTALKTKAVIDSCIGGVLFIDEAYSLSNASNDLDNFSKECIDTLCEALSDHKHDLMVIIAGYENELKRDFFGANRGLESRFVWRYTIDSYNAGELREIFIKKVNDCGWTLNESVDVAWFEKEKDKFKCFGRDMETLLFYVKISHSRRVFGLSDEDKRKITKADMKNGMDMFSRNKPKDEDSVKKYLLNTMYT